MEIIKILVDKIQVNKIFADKYFDRMRQHGQVCIYDRENFADRAYYLDFVKGATVIVTSWGSPVIDEDVLANCPDLKAVLHAAGTVKAVVTDAFVEKKMRITNSACAIGEGVAETALGLAISACKRFFALSADTKNGLWSENKSKVKDFYDIKVGVISGGFVGRHMVKLLHNFHVDVLMYDPILTKEEIAAIGAEKVSLEELLASSDVISVHAPSIPATDNMINKDNLKLIQDGAVLINTSRGSVIEEAALIEELKTGRFFACIDVTNPEPPAKDNGLRALDNVVLTPHIAGTVTNGLRRIALHICEELDRLVAGEKMRTEVNLDNLSKLA